MIDFLLRPPVFLQSRDTACSRKDQPVGVQQRFKQRRGETGQHQNTQRKQPQPVRDIDSGVSAYELPPRFGFRAAAYRIDNAADQRTTIHPIPVEDRPASHRRAIRSGAVPSGRPPRAPRRRRRSPDNRRLGVPSIPSPHRTQPHRATRRRRWCGANGS